LSGQPPISFTVSTPSLSNGGATTTLTPKMMPLFSQRKGIRPIEKAVQREAIDDELKNRLWSALKVVIWDNWSPRDVMGYANRGSQQVEGIVRMVWLHYFKLPTDTIPPFDHGRPRSSYTVIRDHFFEGEWWQTYDLLEFLLKVIEDDWALHLKEICNSFLEAENAAYRIVDNEILEITDAIEVEAIETALETEFQSVSAHLKQSLGLLSDRTNPDYRNAIKEAISAVEAACRILSKNDKATLGDALKQVESKHQLHPALKGAFTQLYGYTSDSGGLRHALTEKSISPAYSDAKFMLVACSAFVNFLWTKAAETGLSIKKD